jgi:hypothetical protein
VAVSGGGGVVFTFTSHASRRRGCVGGGRSRVALTAGQEGERGLQGQGEGRGRQVEAGRCVEPTRARVRLDSFGGAC